MTLTVNSLGDNPQTPGIYAEAYIPDQLIAGNHKLVTDSVTILSGQVLQRGSVLGKITASGKYILALSAAGDGSQTPVAIAADYIDASGGDVVGGIYLAGEFNSTVVTLGTGITLAAATAALRPLSIYLKTNVPATDPT
ncbi:MAG: hypothetical protein JWR22_1326 [Herminiimonas sp.]|nr:hypothetical protein [Herminiimonas sp.]